MFDGAKIGVGLIVFVGVVAFPVWYGLAKGSKGFAVELSPPPNGETQCVAETKNGYMRAEHMHILDQWRNEVVREGNRDKWKFNGQEFEKSLTKNCLSCHSNKQQFCDQCHDASGVTPTCWECHVVPEGSK